MSRVTALGPNGISVRIEHSEPLSFILGPCVIESRQHALECAHAIAEQEKRVGYATPWIFKASFDKANRSSGASYRGPGMAQGLDILAEVRAVSGRPVLTDVHEPWQCDAAAEVVDVLQIPAFLCRQTDLIVSAVKTGKPVNIKKGQFLAPEAMHHALEKAGAHKLNVFFTERGSSFGYENLVVDFRSLAIMARHGTPVIFDATHSVQRPAGSSPTSSGDREFVPALARAAVAVGVAGIFLEVHPDPDKAPSDGANMLPIHCLGRLLTGLCRLDRVSKDIGRAENA